MSVSFPSLSVPDPVPDLLSLIGPSWSSSTSSSTSAKSTTRWEGEEGVREEMSQILSRWTSSSEFKTLLSLSSSLSSPPPRRRPRWTPKTGVWKRLINVEDVLKTKDDSSSDGRSSSLSSIRTSAGQSQSAPGGQSEGYADPEEDKTTERMLRMAVEEWGADPFLLIKGRSPLLVLLSCFPSNSFSVSYLQHLEDQRQLSLVSESRPDQDHDHFSNPEKDREDELTKTKENTLLVDLEKPDDQEPETIIHNEDHQHHQEQDLKIEMADTDPEPTKEQAEGESSSSLTRIQRRPLFSTFLLFSVHLFVPFSHSLPLHFISFFLSRFFN